MQLPRNYHAVTLRLPRSYDAVTYRHHAVYHAVTLSAYRAVTTQLPIDTTSHPEDVR